VAIDAPSLVNNTVHEYFPSAVRQEFKQQFNVTINGWLQDVEANPILLHNLIAALSKEQAQGELPIRTITIEPTGEGVWHKHPGSAISSFFRKNLLAKLGLLVDAYSGWCNPLTANITIMRNTTEQVITHEIKHARTFTNPHYRQLSEQWSRLTRQQGQAYQHQDWMPWAFSRVGSTEQQHYATCPQPLGTEMLFGEVRHQLEAQLHLCMLKENLKRGFSAADASTIVFEDIADASADAEVLAAEHLDLLLQSPMMEKLQLAQQYGLIPREFLAYAALGSQNNDAEFMRQSTAFLKQYPRTTYEAQIRLRRGNIHSAGFLFRGNNALPPAIEEWKQGMAASLLPKDTYLGTLEQIANAYERLQHPLAKLYKDAHLAYHDRLVRHDTQLYKRGVNDLLAKYSDLTPAAYFLKQP
jgi:hypothetical protein